MKFFAYRNMLLILGDILITILSVYAAVYLRFVNEHYSLLEYSPLLLKGMIFSVCMIFMCFFLGLYAIDKTSNRKLVLLKILFAGLLTSIILAAFYYFIPLFFIGRGVLMIALLITIICQTLWHEVYSILLKFPLVADRVLILGTGPVADTMGKLLDSNKSGLALAGYINCVGESIHVPSSSVIGSGEGLLATATRERVQKIVVSLNERRGTLPVREVLDCKLRGIDVVDGPSFYEKLTGKLLLENMNPSHLIFSDGFKITAVRRIVKRIFDVLVAILSIAIACPLFIVVPLLIKLDSRGPVFFKQQRVGEGEKSFSLYKFRTMIDDAERKSGPVWSNSGDKRITGLGKILRKMRIDEIPQLFNVIRGDMSFVGPRPERPFFVESLKKQIPFYSERHCIKPGITGWAQVRYKYGDSIEDAIEKLRYDLYYIKYQSISLDILIALDTIKVILSGFGGR